MTKQEMFDKVWEHFIVNNNEPAISPITGACCYRTPDGKKCAFGIFIPDELYSEEFEGLAASTVIQHKSMRIAELLLGENPNDNWDLTSIGFMDKLQVCHDESAKESTWNEDLQENEFTLRPNFREHMKMMMVELAQRWGLNCND